MILTRGMLALSLVFWGSVGFSQAAVLECVAKGSVLPINNEDVSAWKTSTKDQYRNRGHVAGTISQTYADHAISPPSPDGAILHWVHRSPSARHDSGFVVIDGVVCGQN